MGKSNSGGLKYVIIGAVVLAMVVSLFNFGLNVKTSSPNEVGIQYNSAVCKTVTRMGGAVENLGCSHNTFKNEGRNITRDLIGTYAGLGAVNVIGLANGTGDDGTAAQSNINGLISDCGLAAAAGSYSVTQVSAGNWTIAKTFTSTCNGEVVNATALYNSTAAGAANYFAANNFGTSTTLQSGDQLVVTWFVWLT